MFGIDITGENMKTCGILAVVMAVMAGNVCATDISSLQDTAAVAVSVAQSQDYEASQNMLSNMWDSGLKLKSEAPPVMMSAPAVLAAGSGDEITESKPASRPVLGAKVPLPETKSLLGAELGAAGGFFVGMDAGKPLGAFATAAMAVLAAVCVCGAGGILLFALVADKAVHFGRMGGGFIVGAVCGLICGLIGSVAA